MLRAPRAAPHYAPFPTYKAAQARALGLQVEAFEAARSAGRERARRGDLLIEVPAYFSAKRLLARAAALRVEGA